MRLKRLLFNLFSVPAKGSQATAEARPLLLHLSLGTSQAAGLAKGLAVVTSSTSSDVQVWEGSCFANCPNCTGSAGRHAMHRYSQ